MEELEIIKTKLLASHKKIAKGLNLSEGKSIIIDGIYFFISDCTLLARINFGDLEIEVNEFREGVKRISITGDISEAIKALYKPMMQWKKTRTALINKIN